MFSLHVAMGDEHSITWGRELIFPFADGKIKNSSAPPISIELSLANFKSLAGWLSRLAIQITNVE